MISNLFQSRRFNEKNGHLPFNISSAQGIYVQDEHGKKYINAYGGLSLPFGFGRNELIEAVSEQIATMPYIPLNGISSTVTEEYARKLSNFVPCGPWTSLFVNSGSEAVDSALKAARLFWTGSSRFSSDSRSMILSFSNSYHGQTIGAMAVSGIYQDFENHSSKWEYGVDFAPSPLPNVGSYESGLQNSLNNSLELLEERLKNDRIGTVIIEPVIGAGGVYFHPPDYWVAFKEIIDRKKILLIIDESATCAGRTGEKFAFTSTGLKPDILILAKGINGGYLPSGVLMLSENVTSQILQSSEELFSTSQGGNSIIAKLGIEALNIFEKERPWENASRQGGYLIGELKKISKEITVRGRGLLIGIDFNIRLKENIAFEAQKIMREKGVLIYAKERFIGFFPPLSISDIESGMVIDSFRECIKELGLS